MHAFVLPHKHWWTAWKYKKGTAWWMSAEDLIAKLKQGQPPDRATETR